MEILKLVVIVGDPIQITHGGLTDWGAHHFGGATFALDVRDLQPEEIILQEDEGQKHITFKYPNGKQIVT